MPDDYYVSQYSGEEIDALLGGAGTGTVRYDAAQTLTDEQRTQARGNINASPGGFGLGDFQGVALESSVEGGLNTAVKCGWYYFGGDGSIANAPSLPGGGYGTLLVSSRASSSTVVQMCFFETVSTIAIRRRVDSEWQPWEYLNPPMQLGVEYRTTERYLGKPVYVRLVSCGSAPSNSLKKIDTGLDYTVIDRRLTPTGNMYASSNDNFSIPCESTNVAGENLNIVHGTYKDSGNVRHDAIFIYTTSTTLTGYTVYVVLKYTKTTD